jgi:hypothetical protein
MSKDIVPFDRPALDAKLLAAFRQAEKDGRMDVADHILAAIEMTGRAPAPATIGVVGRQSAGSRGFSGLMR